METSNEVVKTYERYVSNNDEYLYMYACALIIIALYILKSRISALSCLWAFNQFLKLIYCIVANYVHNLTYTKCHTNYCYFIRDFRLFLRKIDFLNCSK